MAAVRLAAGCAAQPPTLVGPPLLGCQGQKGQLVLQTANSYLPVDDCYVLLCTLACATAWEI